MLSVNNMDLPSDCNRLMSDDKDKYKELLSNTVQLEELLTKTHRDVGTLVQDEFQRQIFLDSEKSEMAPTTGNTDLWDNLWKPVHPPPDPHVDPPVDPAVNQINPAFCLACDTMFNNRLSLEAHICPFVCFICSCGVSFNSYPEVVSHSATHSHKSAHIFNHKSAMQNRMKSARERESKLKILEQTVKNVGIVKNTVPFHSAPTLPPPPASRYAIGQTTNLGRRFKPVVKLDTLQKFNSGLMCKCAICRKLTESQDELIEHVSATHCNTCIYGCSHCGLLLIGTVPPKPHHRCGPLQSTSYKKFTTGQMLKDPLSAESLYMRYACQYCSLKFCHPVHLSNHIKLNHTTVSKLKDKTQSKESEKEVQNTLDSALSESQAQNINCAICGSRIDSIKMLEQHWCTRELTLIKPETVAKMTPEQAQQISDSCPSPGSDSNELTFRFQGIHSMKTYGHRKLLTIKTEPVEVNVKMPQTAFSNEISVKTEPELHVIDNRMEKATTEMNGLFYQKYNAPDANNLKYLFSSI